MRIANVIAAAAEVKIQIREVGNTINRVKAGLESDTLSKVNAASLLSHALSIIEDLHVKFTL